MGFKLVESTGVCACSNCHKIVKPDADHCDSCGTKLYGEHEAKSCPNCFMLIGIEENVCPLCDEKLEVSLEEKGEEAVPVKMDTADEAFLTKLLSWTGISEAPPPETKEDVEQREHAMRVLRSIAIVEQDEVIEGHIREIEETAKEREEFEKRRTQLLRLGKPFETILERNIKNVDMIDKELEEKNAELQEWGGKKGKKAQESRKKLKKGIKGLKTKKQILITYEESILMIGGAYRRLLDQQQNELLKIEADLKKRVQAFQKEVERRGKQKERLEKQEQALDRREVELSNRFLDLKKRENEIVVRENSLKKGLEELVTKEEELKRWESESVARDAEAHSDGGKDGKVNVNKEKWLEEQKKLQADLLKMKEETAESGKNIEKLDEMDMTLKKKEESLKEREGEIEELKNELKELNAVIIEKDKEIEKLKDSKPEFTVDEETRKILKILDDLLEKLPEEVVDKFAKSDGYFLYEKVLEKYKL